MAMINVEIVHRQHKKCISLYRAIALTALCWNSNMLAIESSLCDKNAPKWRDEPPKIMVRCALEEGVCSAKSSNLIFSIPATIEGKNISSVRASILTPTRENVIDSDSQYYLMDLAFDVRSGVAYFGFYLADVSYGTVLDVSTAFTEHDCPLQFNLRLHMEEYSIRRVY